MITMVASDEGTRDLQRRIERVAQSDLSVLLIGETGVGKEVCAELLHRSSPRANGQFVRLNCAALPSTLLESELFGHEKGAFTGAIDSRPGLLEVASGGTLFLDEIAEMPRETQAKLLRALDSREILRIGARQPRKIDLRIVAATNEDLAECVARGRFRNDLYFRINGVTIGIPPLRTRPGDILALARTFLERAARRPPAPTFSDEAMRWLRAYSWPGNVRELRNVIERAVVLCDGPTIEVEHFAMEEKCEEAPTKQVALRRTAGLHGEVHDLERRRILEAMTLSNGNQRAAARILGVSRGGLRRRLEKLGIDQPKFVVA